MSTELDFFGYMQEKEELLDSDFLNAMADNMRRGLKFGRQANDWKYMDENRVTDRLNAIERHLIIYRKKKESKHLAAIACNALIVWWHRTREMLNE